MRFEPLALDGAWLITPEPAADERGFFARTICVTECYDERQLCSPGFNLPVGRLTRSVNDGYAQYHSSADDQVLEGNGRHVNLLSKGEPRLGKRGLYGSMGGNSPADSERAMLWVLNQSDGRSSLFDISRRSGMDFKVVRSAAKALQGAGLLAEQSTGGDDR